MGKGSRNRELRISENQATSNPGAKLSKKQLIKQQEQKAKIKKYITMIASLVIVVGLVVAIVVVTMNKSPKLEATVSATSEKYEINNGMMAYFLYGQYQSYVSQYSGYLSYLGLDTSKSLKSQTMYDGTTSWFTYFMNLAKTQVNELVALASEAQEKGYALDEEEIAEIDEYMKSLESYAKSSGYSSVNKYLSAMYCSGVTASAVRDCLELEQLAYKYYNDLVESYEYEDSEIEEYVENNLGSFYKFDYIEYTFDADYDSDATDAEKTEARNDAKAEAEEFLSKVTTEEEFKELINELEKAKAEAEAKDKESTADSGDDSEEKEEKDYSEDFITEGGYYTEDDKFSEWAFDSERTAGEMTVIENVNSSDEVTGYSVYYLIKTAYKDDYVTKNVMHILFTKDTYGDEDAAKAEAEKILAEYNNGDKTKEAFAALAEKYSEDGGSNTNGGLYEEVVQDYMVEEFNDWIYDEKREVGDVEIITTDYGAHIMYFVGDGREVWKVNAESGLKNEQYTEEIEDLIAKHPVTYDNEKLTLIP